MHIKLIGINARYTHSCLALFYVRNELVSHCDGLEIDILQFSINDPYYEMILNLTQGKPDYIFFSAAVWNSEIVCRLISDIKNCLPSCCCVVGGPQAEVVGLNVGKQGCTVVKGEIERIGEQFFHDLKGKSLGESYVCRESARGFSMPYLQNDFNTHLQNRHIYYETSRGCPFACTYCLSSANKSLFHKELEQIKNELNCILHYNPGVIRFVDRTFNDSPQRALALWKFLATCKCDTVFHFEISPEKFTEEMFAFFTTLPVGKFQFEIGIQSTHEPTLEAVRRKIDTESAHEIITRIKGNENIHLHVDLILGLPYETHDTFLKSFRDVFAMNPHYIQMGLLKILPDTPICHTADEYGYIYSSSPPYSIFANNWLDHDSLQFLYWFCECVESFVNNRYFVSLWDYFRQNSVDIVAFFMSLLKKCQQKHFFQRAATQELMCSMIIECVSDWPQYNYILELLRYDWLRCGHRFLPEIFKNKIEQPSVLKKKLYNHLSQFSEKYTKEELSYYFKKGFFQKFSQELVKGVGFEMIDDHQFLCFLPEKDGTLHGFSKIAAFSSPVWDD